jgi:hypothetical protein
MSFEDGSVRAAESLDAADWTLVEQPGGSPVYRTAARAGMLIYPGWSEESSTRVLRGWLADGRPPVDLYVGTAHVLDVALSEDAMAWTAVAGPEWSSGIYSSFQFLWSPIARTATDMEVAEGPQIPFTTTGGFMDVAGDWIATEGCGAPEGDASACRIAVLRRSTGEVFLLRAPDGKGWALLAVAPDEVLLAENDVVPSSPAFIQRLTRLQSDSFPAWHVPL